MSKSVLDEDGLLYLWSKIKSFVSSAVGTKVDQSEYESTNQIFNASLQGLNHEKVDKIEGKGLSTNDFTDEYKNKLDQAKTTVTWDDVANKPDLSSVYNYKGSVATFGDLPTENVSVGDVYDVQTDDMNYAWTGTKWDQLGSTFTITSITNAEIDAIVTGS